MGSRQLQPYQMSLCCHLPSVSIVKLLKAFDNCSSPRELPNVCYREKGDIAILEYLARAI